MATITIEDVPENVIKSFGKNVSYKCINLSFLPKKRKQVNRLIWLSKEEIEKKFYNKKEQIFWPFEWEENSTFLKSFMK